jgi:hypothetical protein
MGEPPRLSESQLPLEKRIIYFVTLWVKDRHHVLTNAKVFEAIEMLSLQSAGIRRQ